MLWNERAPQASSAAGPGTLDRPLTLITLDVVKRLRTEPMKTLLGIATAIALSSSILAQEIVVNRTGAVSSSTPYDFAYDMESQITFRGIVSGIQRLQPSPNSDAIVTLLVKNDDGGGTAVVELGPSWFVDRQALQIKVKDAVQVTGSKIMVEGKGVILAKLVQVATEVLALRRPNGVPYWTTSAAIVPLGPYNGAIANSGSFNTYRYFTEDGSVYSGLLFSSPYSNVTMDMGPMWFNQPPGFVVPFAPNISIGTTGTYWLGGMSGYIPVFRF